MTDDHHAAIRCWRPPRAWQGLELPRQVNDAHRLAHVEQKQITALCSTAACSTSWAKGVGQAKPRVLQLWLALSGHILNRFLIMTIQTWLVCRVNRSTGA